MEEQFFEKLYSAMMNNGVTMGIDIKASFCEAFMEQEMRMQERKVILENYTIWQNQNDERFYTHIRVDGKRKLISRKDKKDLEDYLVKMNRATEIDAPKSNCIEAVFYEWLNYKLDYDGISKRTFDRYRQDFNRFFPPESEWRSRSIGSITEDELEQFVRETIRDNQLTAKGWEKLRLILRGMFQYGKKHKYTRLSFTEFLDGCMLSKKMFAKKVVKDEEQIFTVEEQNMLEEHFFTKPSLTALGNILIFYTGLRICELSALTRKDIKGDTLIVDKQEISYLDEKTGKRVFEVRDFPKTDAGVRRVVLPQKAIDILGMIERYTYSNKDGYLFCNKDGRIHGDMFSQKLRRACKTLGLIRRSSHKARKTYATRLINSNVPKSIIIKQMGHTDFSTTENYYYFSDQKKKDVIETIEGAFDKK